MPEPQKPFTLGKWKNFTTYRCRSCKFDTTEEDVAWEHFKTHTGKRAPREGMEQEPEPSPILVADKRGREVQPGPPAEIMVAEPDPPKRKARKRVGG